jgi:hypothetical protein
MVENGDLDGEVLGGVLDRSFFGSNERLEAMRRALEGVALKNADEAICDDIGSLLNLEDRAVMEENMKDTRR